MAILVRLFFKLKKTLELRKSFEWEKTIFTIKINPVAFFSSLSDCHGLDDGESAPVILNLKCGHLHSSFIPALWPYHHGSSRVVCYHCRACFCILAQFNRVLPDYISELDIISALCSYNLVNCHWFMKKVVFGEFSLREPFVSTSWLLS